MPAGEFAPAGMMLFYCTDLIEKEGPRVTAADDFKTLLQRFLKNNN